MYVGGQVAYFINNKPIFLKLRIFANFNTVSPVMVLVFDFEEFSEEFSLMLARKDQINQVTVTVTKPVTVCISESDALHGHYPLEL
jgi:hypothetical protein